MSKTKRGATSEILANVVVTGMQERKGEEIVLMDLRKTPNSFCDFFVICSGNSDKHLEGLVESVEKEVYLGMKEDPISKEGVARNGWVVLDYFNVVVHFFLKTERDKFGLEALWGDAEIKKIDNTVEAK